MLMLSACACKCKEINSKRSQSQRQIKNGIETMFQLSSQNDLSYGSPHVQVYHIRKIR